MAKEKTENEKTKEKLRDYLKSAEKMSQTRDLLNAADLENTSHNRNKIRKLMRELAKENGLVHTEVVSKRLYYWYGTKKPSNEKLKPKPKATSQNKPQAKVVYDPTVNGGKKQ